MSEELVQWLVRFIIALAAFVIVAAVIEYWQIYKEYRDDD